MFISRQKIFLFLILLLLFSSKAIGQDKNTSDNSQVKKIEETISNQYRKLSLSGNIQPMQQLLFEHQNKSPKLKKLNDKFTKRFVLQKESFESSGDKFVDETLSAFRNYWIKVLMQEVDSNTANMELNMELGKIAAKYKFDPKQNPIRQVRKEFAKRGFFLLTGVTAPYRELMIWKRQDEKTYKVELTDVTQDVTVVALYGFVSKGWLSFSSFGINASAGWATKDKLFVVASQYEIGSESFEVSYLKHEARHLVDRNKFPNLKSFEMEYRAKLTELIYAEKTSIKLINKFIIEANKDSKNAHPLGNYNVVKDMSKAIFNKDYEGNIEEWKKIKTSKIQQTARKLLEQNTKKLRQLK